MKNLTTHQLNNKASLRLRLLKPLMVLAALLISMGLNASTVKKDVFTYSSKPLLKLSRYTMTTSTEAESPTKLRPCVIFAFGGGFTHGNRDDERYEPYFRFMAEQGYVVCSIDYRTTLSEFNPSNTGTDALTAYGQALAEAITAATTDYLTATGYVLANASQWGVDPTRIIASGSSAGAITALQAEYALINNRPAAIPEQFNYAAAVTFAGALFTQGEPQNLNKFCPAMLFQGDADMQVPYNKLVLGPVGLYGSRYLATQFKTAGNTGAFWTELGAGHEMALTPMTQNLDEIAGLLNRVFVTKQPGYAWTSFTVPGRGDYKTDFTIMDYIRGNMP